MANLYAMFKGDAKAEVEGIEVPFGDATFRVARVGGANAARIAKINEAVTRPYRRQMELNLLPQEKVIDINVEVFVRGVLLGWENVEDENGPLPYTVENAKKLLKDLPEVFNELMKVATDRDSFKAELENDAKN